MICVFGLGCVYIKVILSSSLSLSHTQLKLSVAVLRHVMSVMLYPIVLGALIQTSLPQK